MPMTASKLLGSCDGNFMQRLA